MQRLFILLFVSLFIYSNGKSQNAEITWGLSQAIAKKNETVSFAYKTGDNLYVIKAHVPENYVTKGSQRIINYDYPGMNLVTMTEFEMKHNGKHLRYQFSVGWNDKVWVIGELYETSDHIQKLFAQELDLSKLELKGEPIPIWEGVANDHTNFSQFHLTEKVLGGWRFSPDSTYLFVYSMQNGHLKGSLLDKSMKSQWEVSSKAFTATMSFVPENHIGVDYVGNVYIPYRDYKINPVGRNGGDPDYDVRVLCLYKDGHPERKIKFEEPGKMVMSARMAFHRNLEIVVFGTYTEHGKYSETLGSFFRKYAYQHSTHTVSELHPYQTGSLIHYQDDKIKKKVHHIVDGGKRATADPYLARDPQLFNDESVCLIIEREFDPNFHHNASTRTDADVDYHYGDLVICVYDAHGKLIKTTHKKKNKDAIKTEPGHPAKLVAGGAKVTMMYRDFDTQRDVVSTIAPDGTSRIRVVDSGVLELHYEESKHIGGDEMLIRASDGINEKLGIVTLP